jgi:hypothetical protein
MAFPAWEVRVRTVASMPATFARRRVVLRAIVLVQLALVVLVAWSVRELVAFDSQVAPGMVFLTTAMLACTAVALRATFRRADGLRGHRFAFMSAEALCVLLPVVAEYAYGVLRTVPAGVSSSGLVETMMGLELLAAGCVAAVATFVAPYLLAPPPGARANGPNESALVLWAAIAVIATVAIGGLYKTRYDETHTPEFLLNQLFATESPVQQRLIAARLVEAKATDDPEIRELLYEWVESGPVDEKTWAAYLLIASKDDDGRAMAALRGLVGGFATLRAVETMALLGAASAPALPELARAMRQNTEDWLIAEIQTRASDALAQIGPPAIETVPALVTKLNLKNYWELRLSAAAAIDRIDPDFAGRCVVGAPSVLDAIPAESAEVELKPECLG